VNTWIRRVTLGVLEYDFANKLLVNWTMLGAATACHLPFFSQGYFRHHLAVGIWAHGNLLRYWFYWLSHYLRTDNGWPETQSRMLKNPLCPVGVWWYYKQILFEMTPEQLSGFLVDDRLLQLYRERQKRCGFVPQA
jgi:hypothetical protein